MYRKIGHEIGNNAENKVNLHGLVGLVMSDTLSCKLYLERESRSCKGRLNNEYQWKVLLKLRLMDGLSKKIIALVWKWARASLPGRGWGRYGGCQSSRGGRRHQQRA